MENQINRPYLAFDSILSEALQHTLPQIIPPAHDEDAQYPLPSVVFRMFDYTDVPEVRMRTSFPFKPRGVMHCALKKASVSYQIVNGGQTLLNLFHAIERYLIEEQLHIIVYSNFLERKDWYGFRFVCICRLFAWF